MKNGINIKEIKFLSDYIKIFTKLNEDNKNSNKTFFRGHSNINFCAEPSLFRDKFYKNESYMYRQLSMQCQSDLLKCRTYFETISLMKHYGLPTRLLDITSNPLIALYFACENTKYIGEVIVYNIEDDKIKYENNEIVTMLSCLPMFSYEQHKKIYNNLNDDTNIIDELKNEIKIEKPTFNMDITIDILTKPIFVLPNRNNNRIINQKGAFILFGLKEELMEEIEDTKESIINNYRDATIYYISSDKKKSILNELRMCGIDKSFIYPEIENVADDIKNNI